jgi:hypothetical protein
MSGEDAIDNFYKLKGSYDAKYARAKQRIMDDDSMSIEQKRAKTSKILRKCVGCLKNVSTNFSSSNRELVATCGDTNAPCGLDIRIKLGLYNYLPTLSSKIDDDIAISKLEINRIKLNLLFGLVDEEQMVESFEKVKTTYKSLSIGKNVVDEATESLRLINIEDVGGQREIKRTRLAEINQIRLGNVIREFRQLILESENSSAIGQEDNKRAQISDAIELYQTQIIPISKIIREALYDINTVTHERGLFKLIQIKTAFNKLIFEVTSPEVISNKK